MVLTKNIFMLETKLDKKKTLEKNEEKKKTRQHKIKPKYCAVQIGK